MSGMREIYLLDSNSVNSKDELDPDNPKGETMPKIIIEFIYGVYSFLYSYMNDFYGR